MAKVFRPFWLLWVLLILLLVAGACRAAPAPPTPTPTAVLIPTPVPATAPQPAAPTPTPVTGAPVPSGATPTPVAAPQPGGDLVPFAQVYAANPPRRFTEGDIRRGGTFVTEYSGDPPHFDPDLTTSYYTLGAVGPVYSRLLRPVWGAMANPYSPEIVPDLAERWEASADGLTYTFSLRKDVTWQETPYYDFPEVEGKPFTCEDAKFSLERDAKNATAFLVANVDTIACVDTYTLRVTLKRRDPGFLPNLASSYAYIIPKALVEKTQNLRQVALGTGPFLLKEYKPKSSLTYEANPKYFVKGVPYLEQYKIVIISEESTRVAAFRAGHVHYTGTNLPSVVQDILRTHPKTVVHRFHIPAASFHISFRLDKEPWNNPDVRRAISMAINREEMNRLVYDGQGQTYNIGVPWPAAFDKPPPPEAYGPYYQYNPQGAKDLLNKAGLGRGITADYVYYAYGDDRIQQSEMIQRYLDQIGVKISVQRLDYGVWTQQFLGQQWKDLALGFTVPAGGMALGYDWTYELMKCKASKNTWFICDPELDALLEKTVTETDPLKLKEVYRQIWEREVNQVYRAYIAQEVRYSLWHPWVRNVMGWTGYRFDQFTYGGSHVATVWLDDPAKYR